MYQGQARLHELALEHIQLYHGEKVELIHNCSLLEPGRGSPTFMPVRLVLTDYQIVFKCEAALREGLEKGDEKVKTKARRSQPIFYVPLMCIHSVWREDYAGGENRRLIYIQTKTVQLFLLRLNVRFPMEFRHFDTVWRGLSSRPYQLMPNFFCWGARNAAAEHGLLPSQVVPMLNPMGGSTANMEALALPPSQATAGSPKTAPPGAGVGQVTHTPFAALPEAMESSQDVFVRSTTDMVEPVGPEIVEAAIPPACALLNIRSQDRFPYSPDPEHGGGGSGILSSTRSPQLRSRSASQVECVQFNAAGYLPTPATPTSYTGVSSFGFEAEETGVFSTHNSSLTRSQKQVKSFYESELHRLCPNPAYRLRWAVTECNKDYKLCSTYPEFAILPRSANLCSLPHVANFRAQGRFPIISWIHPNNCAVLARCSQPKMGPMRGGRSNADELLVILLTPPSLPNSVKFIDPNGDNGSHARLAIADARGYYSAMGNQAKGGGSEIPEHYQHAQHLNLDLPNIHVIRESWSRLCKLSHISCDSWKMERWLLELVNTGWLSNIHNIIEKAFQIVLLIEEQATSVLVHCSDGWDRTSQLCGLASLLVDPYYRTIRGFQALIEKDWLLAGHRFAERCATGGGRPDDQFSPIFLQWMDCVWQIWRQHSTAFEFNDIYLAYILEHVYSCRFGTFLCNCDRERVENDLATKTLSLWDNINAKMDRFRNVLYDDSNPRVLVPSRHHSQIILWDSMYFSFHCSASVWRQRYFNYVTVPLKLQELHRRLQQYQSRAVEQQAQLSEAICDELLREIVNAAVAEAEAALQEQQVLGVPCRSPTIISPHELHMESSWAEEESEVRWVPDHLARTCAFCRKPFTIFRRKHHCRSCGRVFCHVDCTPLNGVRTCRKCAAARLQQQQQQHLAENTSTASSSSPSRSVGGDPHLEDARQQQQNSPRSGAAIMSPCSPLVRPPKAVLLPHLL
eukprot:RCo020143